MNKRVIKKYKRKKLGKRPVIRFHYLRETLFWIIKIALVCGLAYFITYFWGQRVSIIGDSMNPILSNKDVCLVNRATYLFGNPKRGDIVVFRPGGNENSHYYVKRVIGLPGDKISIMENTIFINGEKLKEKYKTTEIKDVGIVGDEITLKNDEYFVLGDNRNNSEDSRNADIGNIKKEYILGKVWMKVSSKIKFI
ncbi:MAG: signal peptidase I [Lachnospiraceae bacterium]|jgi:signal peptidase I|nr:signal peptidase I [Lachnospiraceae bacterium]